MSSSKPKLYVTKLAAAQRQLRAAIRMYFSREDELAIHTVASAAYRLIADLKKHRGRDEVGDYYLTSIFYCVRDYRRETLPRYLADDARVMAWIKDIAKALPIASDSKFEDIKAEVSPEIAAAFWRKHTFAANFLKHADRDAGASLDLDRIDNLELLVLALSSCSDRTTDSLGTEGLILWLYFCVEKGIIEGVPEEIHGAAVKLSSMDPLARLDCCRTLINQLGERPGLT